MGQASTKSGVVVWGSAEYGQLGIGSLSTEDKVCPPRLLESFRSQSIKCVANGGHHCAAISDSGELYTWGSGRDGQLGHGDIKDVVTPKLVRSLQSKIVRCVSCSDRHSAACLEDGSVYTWGSAANGRLGHVTQETQLHPKLVERLAGEQVITVSCGTFHTAFLTLQPSTVWTCGLGLSGRLGHGDELDRNEPAPIKQFEGLQITAVSCGGHHTACITNTGALYTWGGGAFGKLGLGSRLSQTTPKQVLGPLKNKVVVAVSLGAQHSACVTSKGDVYTWGQAGRLGHEGHGESDTMYPRQVAALSGIFVVSISCGLSHTAVVTETGDAWAWGTSRALGHVDNQELSNSPTCVRSLHGKAIVQVSCGISCCIALSDARKFANKVPASVGKNIQPNLLNTNNNNNFVPSSSKYDDLLANSTFSFSPIPPPPPPPSPYLPFAYSGGGLAVDSSGIPSLGEAAYTLNSAGELVDGGGGIIPQSLAGGHKVEDRAEGEENKQEEDGSGKREKDLTCDFGRDFLSGSGGGGGGGVHPFYKLPSNAIKQIAMLSAELKAYQDQTLLLTKALYDVSKQLDTSLKRNAILQSELSAIRKSYSNEILDSRCYMESSQNRRHESRTRQQTPVKKSHSSINDMLTKNEIIGDDVVMSTCYNSTSSQYTANNNRGSVYGVNVSSLRSNSNNMQQNTSNTFHANNSNASHVTASSVHTATSANASSSSSHYNVQQSIDNRAASFPIYMLDSTVDVDRLPT